MQVLNKTRTWRSASYIHRAVRGSAHVCSPMLCTDPWNVRHRPLLAFRINVGVVEGGVERGAARGAAAVAAWAGCLCGGGDTAAVVLWFAAKERQEVQFQSHVFFGASAPNSRQSGSRGVWLALKL